MENNTVQRGEWLRRILYTLKKNIWLMLAIVIAFTIGGGVVAYTREPVYTASNKVIYAARISLEDSYDSTSLTGFYNATLIDFCDELCVADRASYYYWQYQKAKQTDSKLTVKDYIQTVRSETVDSYQEHLKTVLGQTRSQYEHLGYVNASNISVKGGSGQTNFSMIMSYSDLDSQAAKDKAAILGVAVEKEANASTTGANGTKFFGFSSIMIEDFGANGVSSNIDLSKIVLAGFLFGVVGALLIVYIITLFSKTVKDKEELEMITGASVLSYIGNKEEGK